MTRHSKNELRSLKATLEDVERAVATPIRVDRDADGRPRYTSYIRGVRVRIVLALDEPDLVVTIHMMKADYDSEADAISIDLLPSERFEEQRQVDDDYCVVSFEKGRLVNVALLNPAEHIELLEVAAEHYDLDGTAIVATTRAALAAPDRIVELNLGEALPDSRGLFRHPAG